jgi:hypothetical protein
MFLYDAIRRENLHDSKMNGGIIRINTSTAMPPIRGESAELNE